MKIPGIVVALGMALASGLALADSCPAEMSKIDAALGKKPKLTNAQMGEVMKYRSEGEALHKTGKHQESMEALAKAKKVLGI